MCVVLKIVSNVNEWFIELCFQKSVNPWNLKGALKIQMAEQVWEWIWTLRSLNRIFIIGVMSYLKKLIICNQTIIHVSFQYKQWWQKWYFLMVGILLLLIKIGISICKYLQNVHKSIILLLNYYFKKVFCKNNGINYFNISNSIFCSLNLTLLNIKIFLQNIHYWSGKCAYKNFRNTG